MRARAQSYVLIALLGSMVPVVVGNWLALTTGHQAISAESLA